MKKMRTNPEQASVMGQSPKKAAPRSQPEPCILENAESGKEAENGGAAETRKWRNILKIVLLGVAFSWALQNLDPILSGLRWLNWLVMPILTGCVIAFVLNVPMRKVESLLFPRCASLRRLRRPLAMLLTLILVLGAVALAWMVIVPNVTEAITSLADQAPGAMERLWNDLQRLGEKYPAVREQLAALNMDVQDITTRIITWLKDGAAMMMVNAGAGFVGDMISGVSNFVIAAIFAMYLLAQKEKLCVQGRMCISALLPQGKAQRTNEVLSLTYKTFASFLSCQCLEALILGSMFVLVLTLFQMPYALLIGVLVALTALVPVVGAFVGCGVGFLLIAIVSFKQACIFVVLFLVLQQIEGNLIYPHVVGNSVGLPSIWVLAAVTIGGRLFGVIGMLLFIPLASVAYTLFREVVKQRLAKNKGNPAAEDFKKK